ncbi:copper amine oxidase N-terminal domain-containing protein [Paenibacillus sp. GCM10027626]|uniref:copper amine oxidase N-terminal domain-containing protein n=1 Tax=Paenibacillus sp. GCM10027626 TaxID=3273411 RepID=UPI00362B0EFF
MEVKRETNPDYSTGALWKYSKESNPSYSTSAHWHFRTQINPDYSTSAMWKYKNAINPNYSTGTMWAYKNDFNPAYSTGLMWKLRNESNSSYSTGTMWAYKQGHATKSDTQTKIDRILNEGEDDLKNARESAMSSINNLRTNTIRELTDLRDETLRKLIRQRTESVNDISDLRERYFGKGIDVKPLQISFDQIKVIIDGELQSFVQPPVMKSGNTLVPMRAIFERLGAELKWNNREQSVTAKKDSTTIYLKVGSKQAKVNGTAVTLQMPAQLINGNTMVPLRFISESLGADVKWDKASQTITITTV